MNQQQQGVNSKVNNTDASSISDVQKNGVVDNPDDGVTSSSPSSSDDVDHDASVVARNDETGASASPTSILSFNHQGWTTTTTTATTIPPSLDDDGDRSTNNNEPVIIKGITEGRRETTTSDITRNIMASPITFSLTKPCNKNGNDHNNESVLQPPALLSAVERDLESKNRKFVAGHVLGATTTPGAVAVPPSHPTRIILEPAATVEAAIISHQKENEIHHHPSPIISERRRHRHRRAANPGAERVLIHDDGGTLEGIESSSTLISRQKDPRPASLAAERCRSAYSDKSVVSTDAGASLNTSAATRLSSISNSNFEDDDGLTNYQRMKEKVRRIEREVEARLSLRRREIEAAAAAAAPTDTGAAETAVVEPSSYAVTGDITLNQYHADAANINNSARGINKVRLGGDDGDGTTAVSTPFSNTGHQSSLSHHDGGGHGGDAESTTATTVDRGIVVEPNPVAGDYHHHHHRDLPLLPNTIHTDNADNANIDRPEEPRQGLVIAMSISEGNDDEHYGIATAHGREYDPDSKPRWYKRSRVRLFVVVACVVLLAAVGGTLGATLANRKSSSAKSPSPTLAPTSYRDMQLYSLFQKLVGNNLVLQDGTPHKLAADWIIHDDPMQLGVTSDHVDQRYLMALFYYQMSDSGKSPWRSCNPPTNGENDTCVFLLNNDTQFFNNDTWILYFEPHAMDPETNKTYNRWLSGAHECDWVGNDCDYGRNVITMNLFAQNLVGTLPSELASVSLLTSLNAAFNYINGTIPSEYTKLQYLSELVLHYNLLSGSFPESLFQFPYLEIVNVGHNVLSGSLPSSQLNLFRKLKGLHLFQNHFQGTIPSEIGSIKQLSYARLYHNRFVGTIPTEIGRLTVLEEFWIDGNLIKGSIPSEIGLATALTDLRINNNMISGTIPDEFYNLTKLSYDLNLCNNMLNGTLSTRIGNLTDLEYFLIRGNQLTGTVPSELALLTNLMVVWLDLNQFNGSIPEEICTNPYFTRDGSGVLEADCGPPDNPAQQCSCCTVCCNRQSGACLDQ